MHYLGDDGREQVLRPDPRSAEGRRARFDRRFPRTSAAIGAVGLLVLLVGLAVTLSVAAEQITRVEVVAQQIGTFTSPVRLPRWAAIALSAAGVLAAVDRALGSRARGWPTEQLVGYAGLRSGQAQVPQLPAGGGWLSCGGVPGPPRGRSDACLLTVPHRHGVDSEA